MLCARAHSLWSLPYVVSISVGLGEMLLTNARAFCLDEVSTGLDAAVTLHIFSALKQSCALNHTSVVTALLQSTPETYGLFDDIILLKDGHTVFHGPREDIPSWLWEIAGLEVPQGVDEAGFLVDFLADPATQYDAAAKALIVRQEKELSAEHSVAPNGQAPALIQVRPSPIVADGIATSQDVAGDRASLQTPSVVRIHFAPPAEPETPAVQPSAESQQQQQQFGAEIPNVPEHAGQNGHAASSSLGLSAGPGAADARDKGLRHGTSSSSFAPMYHSRAQAAPVLDADELAARYNASRFHDAMASDVALAAKNVQPLDANKWSAYTHVSYGSRYPHSTLRHMRLNLQRQFLLTTRNRSMVPPRLAQSVIMGLVFGSLFADLSHGKFADRMGLLLYVIMSGAFSNLTELPVASEARNVISKQIDAGFFPSFSYSASVAALHVPIVVAELLIFGTLIYWIPGFYPSADRFFFFLFVLFLNSSALSVLFRSISYVAKNPDVARQMDMPFIIIFVIFGGFCQTHTQRTARSRPAKTSDRSLT